MNPAQLPALVDIAVRTAYARRGVAHLTVPERHPGRRRGARTRAGTSAPARPPATAPIYLAPAGPAPATPTCSRAADVLNGGERSPSWPASARAAPGALVEQLADVLGRADHQDAVRQDGRPGRLAVHHRRASGCWAPRPARS